MLNIIEYDIPSVDFGEENYYIVLESITEDTDKTIHVLDMNHIDKIEIGRGIETHVRCSDSTVSRFNSSISKAKGYFFLLDNKSKFGTLA